MPSKIPLIVLLVYLSLSGADAMPFVLFFAAYAAGGKEKIGWLDAALLMIGVFHLCLLYRWLAEHRWHRPPWLKLPTNFTSDSTPLSTSAGYSATSIVYNTLVIMSFSILPIAVYGRWLFWFVVTTTISVWITIPTFLPSLEIEGAVGQVLLLCTVPPLVVVVATSPCMMNDAIYALCVLFLMAVLLACKMHIYHSMWPWAGIPFCRHSEPERRTVIMSVLAGMFIGIATQEICGSGFHFNNKNGW